jgi:hypothetical protein
LGDAGPASGGARRRLEEQVTPLTILIASIVILAADYFVERHFAHRKSPRPGGLFNDPTNNWLRNPLKETRSHRV